MYHCSHHIGNRYFIIPLPSFPNSLFGSQLFLFIKIEEDKKYISLLFLSRKRIITLFRCHQYQYLVLVLFILKTQVIINQNKTRIIFPYHSQIGNSPFFNITVTLSSPYSSSTFNKCRWNFPGFDVLLILLLFKRRFFLLHDQ